VASESRNGNAAHAFNRKALEFIMYPVSPICIDRDQFPPKTACSRVKQLSCHERFP
jgi:hypothetical protein